MRTLRGISLLFLFPLFCSSAYAFDCNKQDFGAKLSDIDDGNFVLYKQQGGVSFYNYVGGCRLEVHQRACPAISYAFVDGVYYARIMKALGRDKEDILRDIEASLGAPSKLRDEGDWTEYIRDLPGDIVFKLKYNNRTGEARSAMYNKQICEKLKKSTEVDPVEQLTN